MADIALTLVAYVAATIYVAAMIGYLWLAMAIVDDWIHLMAEK